MMPHAADIALSRRTFPRSRRRRASHRHGRGRRRSQTGPARWTDLPEVRRSRPSSRASTGAWATAPPIARPPRPTTAIASAPSATAFAAEDVVIAEVGAWRNMLDPDPQKRADNLALRHRAAGARRGRGARCCVDIAGSFNPTVWYGPHPKNLSQEFFDADRRELPQDHRRGQAEARRSSRSR